MTSTSTASNLSGELKTWAVVVAGIFKKEVLGSEKEKKADGAGQNAGLV
jgi:hypothetical protein